MSETQSGLERWYRRLLWAYPGRYRRVRAEEMVGTLLEAAGPGQRRPTGGQVRDLLLGGVRERLRVPGSGVARFGATWTALVLAWVGFGTGAWLGWQATARDLPSNREATAIARTAFGDTDLDQPVRRDYLFGFDPAMQDDPVLLALLGGDEYDAGAVRIAGRPGGDRTAHEITRRAENRLREAGWRIINGSGGHPWGDETSASNGRYVVTVRYENGNDGVAEVAISREAPWAVPPLAVSGAMAAALAGWLLVGWVCRQVRARWTPGRRALVGGFGYLGLILTFLPTALFLLATWETATTAQGWRMPFWFPTLFIGLRPMMLLAAVLGLGAVVAAVWPRRTGDLRRGTVRPPYATG